MTTAVREIVKQAENLSADEQLELAAWLIGQARESTGVAPGNRRRLESSDAGSQPQLDEEASVIEDEDEAEISDVFSLNRVAPKSAYTMRVRYVFSGKAQPLPYQLEEL